MLEESESLNCSSGSLESGSSEDYLSSRNDVNENYYAIQNYDSILNTVTDLEDAIEEVKARVLETEAVSDERQKMVKRLIELRLQLQDLKEVTEELDPSSDQLRIVQSHQFILQKQYLHRTPQYCHRCNGIIWTVLQNYFKCKGCGYKCHWKCLNHVVRVCQSLKVSVHTEYIPNICPEKGLAFQNFRCAECKSHFTLKNSWMEPRLDDVDGLYYCPICHNNSTHVSPARIIRNWDFEERRVSEASKQFLTLMARKPNINLEQINPQLFTFVEDLSGVKRMREEILMMKGYLLTCREAISQKVLRLLQGRQHFVDSSYMYSLTDLVEVENGSLLHFLKGIHSQFLKHIKQECLVCRGKGFICEICENVEVLFPFDSSTHQCTHCNALFHNICFAKRDSCPKCLRRKRRKESGESHFQ